MEVSVNIQEGFGRGLIFGWKSQLVYRRALEGGLYSDESLS